MALLVCVLYKIDMIYFFAPAQNHQVKGEKQVYLKKLLREAKELSDKLKATETVSRGDVEQAMMDKLSCMADLEQEILQLQLRIEQIDMELEALQKERDRIQKFKVKHMISVLYLYFLVVYDYMYSTCMCIV